MLMRNISYLKKQQKIFFDYIKLCDQPAKYIPPSPLIYVIDCNQIAYPFPPSLRDYVISGWPQIAH